MLQRCVARFASLVPALLLCATGLLAQAGGVQTVVIAQRVKLEGGMTRQQAERLAVENAMAEAVRRVAGVKVSGSQFVVSSDSAGVIGSQYLQSVRLDAEGHVVAWNVERGAWSSVKRGRGERELVYDASVRVSVARDAGRADDGFRVTMSGGADRLLVRGAELAANDEVVIGVTATRDAHLTLVAIFGDSASLLVPNRVLTSAQITGGVPSQWPSADWRERGLHFRVGLPAGVASRTEVLAAIATLEPVEWPSPDGATLPLTEFNRWLVAIPASRRAVAQRTVMVQRASVETMNR